MGTKNKQRQNRSQSRKCGAEQCCVRPTLEKKNSVRPNQCNRFLLLFQGLEEKDVGQRFDKMILKANCSAAYVPLLLVASDAMATPFSLGMYEKQLT